jgi:hypothetical protein
VGPIKVPVADLSYGCGVTTPMLLTAPLPRLEAMIILLLIEAYVEVAAVAS